MDPVLTCPTCGHHVRAIRSERGILVYEPHDDLRKVGLAVPPSLLRCTTGNTPVFYEGHHDRREEGPMAGTDTCHECGRIVELELNEGELVLKPHFDSDGNYCTASGERPVAATQETD